MLAGLFFHLAPLDGRTPKEKAMEALQDLVQDLVHEPRQTLRDLKEVYNEVKAENTKLEDAMFDLATTGVSLVNFIFLRRAIRKRGGSRLTQYVVPLLSNALWRIERGQQRTQREIVRLRRDVSTRDGTFNRDAQIHDFVHDLLGEKGI